MVRKAIESTYDGLCTIIEHQKVKKENKSTGFVDAVVLENQPCRLSFSRISNSDNGGTATTVTQVVKILIAPEIKVKPGSKLMVTQNGVTTDYQCSGEPAVYASHQEIILDLFKGWA